MRKCITGYVGQAVFREALSLIERSSGRSTLFVHNGAAERVLHFSEQTILCFPLPAGSPAASSGPLGILLAARLHETAGESGRGAEDPPAAKDAPPRGASGSCDAYREAAEGYLTAELIELSSWRNAFFELRPGPLPKCGLGQVPALEIAASPALVLGEFRRHGGPAPEECAAGGWLAELQAPARVERLTALIPGALSGHLFLRELASAWSALGQEHRAAACLRDIARYDLDWGAEEAACEVLEEALRLCPVDAAAAETLVSIHLSAGRAKQAESVTEAICTRLEAWRAYQLIVHLYRALNRVPESLALRRLAAEAMIRSGDILNGLRELRATAGLLESRGDVDAASRMYERVVEVDASDAEAQQALRRARSRRLFASRLTRWGSPAAALLVLILWIFWDLAAASALGRVQRQNAAADVRSQVNLYRGQSARFPVSLNAWRLSKLLDDLYRRSFDSDAHRLREAWKAQQAGDAGTADHLFGEVSRQALLPVLALRAQVGRGEISRQEARKAALLQQAKKAFGARDYEASFRAYAQMLTAEERSIYASGYSVPVHLETVPAGASIEIDGAPAGRTPSWVVISSDPQTVLKLASPGFQPLEVADPLGSVLETGSCRLRKALLPEIEWQARAWGGRVGQGDAAGPLVVVLGADGVLRGVQPSAPRAAWQTALGAGISSGSAPLVIGQTVLLAAAEGKVHAFSLALGKPLWTAKLSGGGQAFLGPSYTGQVVAGSGDKAVLLNPQTGLICRALHASFDARKGLCAVEGDIGIFAAVSGDVTGIHLRSGQEVFQGPGLAARAHTIVLAGGVLVVAEAGGALRGQALQADGPAWEARLGGECAGMAIAGDGCVVAGSKGGVLLCLRAQTGAPVWKTAVEGSLMALASSGGKADRVLVQVQRRGETLLEAIDPADGSVDWEYAAGSGEALSAQAQEGRVAVSTPSGGIVAFRTPQTRR